MFRLRILFVVAMLMVFAATPLMIWGLFKYGVTGFLWVFLPSMVLYVGCGICSVCEISPKKF